MTTSENENDHFDLDHFDRVICKKKGECLLPPQNESEEFCEFYVMDGNEPNQNVCTKSQVAAAKAKGWLPQYWDEDEEVWLEYEGSEPIREKK